MLPKNERLRDMIYFLVEMFSQLSSQVCRLQMQVVICYSSKTVFQNLARLDKKSLTTTKTNKQIQPSSAGGTNSLPAS